ncbi:RAB6A-GEF complex partner protein 2-like [Tubulanus polymorphus]|uniref:RAB6A-GEF complex partner protein 2-like n=1 Tax=Tubulanus polymorphus TaxID=672921 RepID=UPI003DA4DC9D
MHQIEVNGVLQRGTIYLAGETIECVITFSNRGNPIPFHGAETLAWASAQIHCQRTISESRVNLPTAPAITPTGGTSSSSSSGITGERGTTVLSTKPKILFCDLSLRPGESKSFIYRETIPSEAPPTFKGQAVKYAYKLTIGTQRVETPTKLLRIPFRVLVLHGLNDISVYTTGDGGEISPTNPFQITRKPENTICDIALQVLSTVTARKQPNFYNVTNSKGKVARFCLFKQAYKLGEDIIGTFDFSDVDIPCVQYSVTLQSEEIVSEECRHRPAQGSNILNHTKHHQFCLHHKKTHMTLPIPLSVTPGFITDIVCLRWRLHFEFITSCNKIADHAAPSEPSESSTWRGPEKLEVETMIWDMPVKIFATNPLLSNGASLLRNSSCMNV